MQRVQERDLSRRDTSMGHFRKILERTYKDDVSGGLSVPLADNSPFRLSPFLATEWASAMVSHIPSFSSSYLI
jgi:hypothetical protein